MMDVTDKNFGVIIAFLLPGFLYLWEVSLGCEEVAIWMESSAEGELPGIGSFLYVSLASLAIGLILSAIRWLVIDKVLSLTRVTDAGIDYSMLRDKDRYAAFLGCVENHYRFYQYYANTLVAILCGLITILVAGGDMPSFRLWVGGGVVSLALFLGSRDALKKYYDRSRAILSDSGQGDEK